MKTVVIQKHQDTERHVSIEGDEEETAFVLDLLGLVRADFDTQPVPEDPEPTLQ